ncbi:hypothetical protein FF38_09253 [Lucilia cuprina]|uniref:Uncharacterized protein n=1 Tax=Lucilia cuprina TaxID=7375 RepID=A0A0L0C412_LUCCU|nr:hypothetical protein FF38_09253 [Lucilia cuprina]
MGFRNGIADSLEDWTANYFSSRTQGFSEGSFYKRRSRVSFFDDSPPRVNAAINPISIQKSNGSIACRSALREQLPSRASKKRDKTKSETLPCGLSVSLVSDYVVLSHVKSLQRKAEDTFNHNPFIFPEEGLLAPPFQGNMHLGGIFNLQSAKTQRENAGSCSARLCSSTHIEYSKERSKKQLIMITPLFPGLQSHQNGVFHQPWIYIFIDRAPPSDLCKEFSKEKGSDSYRSSKLVVEQMKSYFKEIGSISDNKMKLGVFVRLIYEMVEGCILTLGYAISFIKDKQQRYYLKN